MVWSENLCRLCGVISPNPHSVFELIGNDTIEYKIKKCLNFSIFREDYKPKEICEQCLMKIENFSDFIDICISTNQRFDSVLLSRNSWPEVNDISVPEFVQPKSVIVNLKSGIECLQDESVDILPLENIGVPLNEDVLQIVQSSNVYDGSIEENLGDYMNTTARYVQYYPDCNNTVLRHSSHIENLPNNLYSESDISYEYGQKGNESIVLTDKSCNNYFAPPQTSLAFEKCFNSSLNVESFDTNSDCVQNDVTSKIKPKETLISIESVRNKLNLKEDCNPTKLKEKKTHKCPHCERIFMRRISLNAHIAIHTKTKPFSCSSCGKSFAVKSDLTIHKKIHSDQYQCRICSKTFVVPSKLERHFRTHTKERPFKCGYENCGKMFSDQSNLAEHESIHANLRNFKCLKCEKCFVTKGQLKSHKLSHKLDMSHTCDICKKSYKYKTNLILHMKKHNGYKCPFCDERCEKLCVLIKHRKECNKK